MDKAAGRARVPVELDAVSETLLWTLYYRASEARRPDGVLRDPLAAELTDRIDFPFESRFGRAGSVTAQIQGLRARCFDEQVRWFLAGHPDGTVVALGEGLETQFWRVDNGRVRWLTVDLPEVTALRRRLLPDPPSGRVRALAGSATDLGWMDRVDATRGVLVVAQGLFMYLPPEQVRRLVAACAQRFPGGGLVFDAVPHWFAKATASGRVRASTGYRAPPMPWALDVDEQPGLRDLHPNIATVRDLRPPRGRGLLGRLLPRVNLIPVLRHKRPSAVLLTFG
ncbi:MAG TPA: class I SAM-dependent methyltransferase [Mycobacteriales bacterium]|nr:class I SAM-dependent methyltransferase [Mycobacteriales bacterium]